MPLFVFTTGEYSNYGIADIYSRDTPLAEGEQAAILASLQSDMMAWEAERERAWREYKRAGGPLNQYEFAKRVWGRKEPDWIPEELARRGFSVEPYMELNADNLRY